MSTSAAYGRIYAPRGGWFGAQLVNTSTTVGTGGTTLVNSTTTSIMLPVPGMLTSFAKAEAVLVALNIQGLVVGVPNSGDMLMTAYRRVNAGTPADSALTDSFSLTSSGLTTTDWTFAWPITASASTCLFVTTDALRLDVVMTDTVTTQPTAVVSGLWAIRRVG